MNANFGKHYSKSGSKEVIDHLTFANLAPVEQDKYKESKKPSELGDPIAGEEGFLDDLTNKDLRKLAENNPEMAKKLEDQLPLLKEDKLPPLEDNGAFVAERTKRDEAIVADLKADKDERKEEDAKKEEKKKK